MRCAGPAPDSRAAWQRAAAERMVCAVLGVADQLVCAPLLLNSPQAAALLVASPPGAPADAERATAEEAVKRIQVRST